MKKISKILTFLLICSIATVMAGCSKSSDSDTSSKDDATFNIVSSFYPMHIITLNLVKGIDDVNATSMSKPTMGCIHDHAFTTEDLKKVENADVFIENGLGLETFNQKILDTYPDVDIIEASKGVLDNQKDGDEINAHIWTNLDNYIQQVKNVSSKLQELDSKHKDEYSKNEDEYVKKLEDLKNEYKDKLAKVSGKKALVLDETLPHLCTYTKLDKVEIKTDHEQESLSSDDLKNVITDMKSNNTKIILVAKNSDKQNAEMISKETGAKIYELNSCMVGDVNENAYIDYMKENFDIISEIE